MGTACVGARSKPYKDDIISNRSIIIENETPMNHHGTNATACGYGFGLNIEELDGIIAHQE